MILPGLRLEMNAPRVVAEGMGYCWYPSIRMFGTGELMVEYNLDADSSEKMVSNGAILLSGDGGATWMHQGDVSGLIGRLSTPLSDGALFSPGRSCKPEPLGQWRTFATHYGRFEEGGRRYSVEPWGARIEGLPRDVASHEPPSRNVWAQISPFRDMVELEPSRYLATGRVVFRGETRRTVMALVSEDEGRTWRYLSTIAAADAAADAREGPTESCLVRLEDGDLMCIMRVGSGRDQLLARTYSSDDGMTWAKTDRLPAWSVQPRIKRLSNGVLVLSTGRPGLFLWFSTDPRGRDWQQFDVMAHHNSTTEKAHHITAGNHGLEATAQEESLNRAFDFDEPQQTTSYTSIAEVAPNRLLMVYDRMPYGWMPVPTDAEVRSRILARYPTSALPAGSMTPRERERIYLLELAIERQ
jgi:hypothetical protein